jgi:hypothetical protein
VPDLPSCYRSGSGLASSSGVPYSDALAALEEELRHALELLRPQERFSVNNNENRQKQSSFAV